MAWATTADVLTITAVTVTDAVTAQAQAIVEMHVNRTPDADAAAMTRDLYWLKQAVCWQAAWLKDQPGFTSRHLVERVEQDGAGFEYAGQVAVTLAPLAIRAIRNLSWIGGQKVLTLSCPPSVPALAFNNEASDDAHLWEPL